MPTSGGLAIVAPNWLGDAVMALPAIADLGRLHEGRPVTVAARAAVAPLFRMVDGVDEVVDLPGRGGWRGVASWRRDAEALASRGFGTVVLLPNSFAAAWAARRAGIPERCGFATDWRGWLLTRVVPRADGASHQAAYYQALASGLGAAPGPLFARVNVEGRGPGPSPASRASARLAAEGIEPGAPFAVFAPGAAYGRAKQWLPERFAELAARIAGDLDWRVVLVGSRADASACREVAGDVAPPARGALVDLAGRTTLDELAGVLAASRGVVANDSGAMHLAAAVGARVVAVFGATDERRTAPLASGPAAAAPIVVTGEAFCRPCLLRECPIDHRCMRTIAADRVFDALREP